MITVGFIQFLDIVTSPKCKENLGPQDVDDYFFLQKLVSIYSLIWSMCVCIGRKEDYDLCSICFSKMGNETDYYRIDRPVQHRFSRSLLKELHTPVCSAFISTLFLNIHDLSVL